MIKAFFFFIFLATSILAKSYNFSEVRYSDALDKSITLHGVISFGDESLKIVYEKNANILLYEDEELSMFDGEEEVDLDESEAIKIAQYFEIIILLYKGDVEKIKEQFSLKNEGVIKQLTPKDEMKEYIRKIILTDTNKQLQSLQFYLSNDDNIKISIADEVR